MNFFSNLFGDSKKSEAEKNDKDKKKKPTPKKAPVNQERKPAPGGTARTAEEQRQAQEVSKIFASVEMPSLSIAQLADFFSLFNSIVRACESAQVKWNSVKKTKDICMKLLLPGTTIGTIHLEGFHPSYSIEVFLEGILTEAMPLRARHVLALHRFCTVLCHEFEEQTMTASNGFLANAYHNTPQAKAGGQKAPPAARRIQIGEVASLDLRRIYLRLLEGTSYLPTAEELNEIIKRANDLFRQERNVISVTLPAVIVGDVHGQIKDLLYHVIANGGPLVHESTLNGHDHSKNGSKKQEGATTYLFLGDYVDRGPNSLQCLCLLYVAKLLSPNTVFLLRGNHESSITNRHYGFLAECHTVYPIVDDRVTTCQSAVTGDVDAKNTSTFSGLDFDVQEHPIWVAANQSFMSLPLAAAIFREHAVPSAGPGPAATVRKKQMIAVAMHGGISPFIENSIDGILAIDRFHEVASGALADLTWSDPLPNAASSKNSLSDLKQMSLSSLTSPPEFNATDATTESLRAKDFSKPAIYSGPPIGYIFSARGTGHNFGEDATCKFINNNKLHFIIRAHQCVQEGYKWCHQNRVVTVFSAPNYCGLGNKGAILLLDEEGLPSTIQYQMSEDSNSAPPVPHPPPTFR